MIKIILVIIVIIYYISQHPHQKNWQERSIQPCKPLLSFRSHGQLSEIRNKTNSMELQILAQKTPGT